MANLLKDYLEEAVMSEGKLGEDLEKKQCDMVKAILNTLNGLKNHDERQKMFDDQLWVLILMTHFKFASTLTDTEVKLYLLRQEKAGGARSRSKEANAKRASRNKQIEDLLFQCYQFWVKREEGKEDVVAEEEEYDDDDDRNDHDDAAAAVDRDNDRDNGKTKLSIYGRLAKEKSLNEKQMKDLAKFDRLFMDKAGTFFGLHAMIL